MGELNIEINATFQNGFHSYWA